MSGGRFRLGPGRGREAPERDLALRRLRQARAAPARDDRGDPADHGEGLDRRADPLRGRLPGHRHQGLGPPAHARSRDGPDLRRGDARGHVPDGRRRRRRADRPPDVPAALARRGGGPQLRDRACSARGGALRPRLHPHRLLRDRRRRGRAHRRGRRRRSPSTRPSAPTSRSGRCTASPMPPTAAGDAFRKGDLAAVPEQIPDEMVEAYTAAGPLDKVREPASPRSPSAATASSSRRRPTSSRRSRSASTRADHRGVRPGLG